MRYLKSKYFIKAAILIWIVGILVVSDIFFSKYIPFPFRPTVETTLACIYILLFLCTTFFLIFKSYSNWEIEREINKLQDEKEKRLQYSEGFDVDELLLKYKKVLQVFSDRVRYIHVIKSKDEITNMKNVGNYFIILLILFVGQFSFDYLDTIGPIVFFIMVLTCIIFCIRILIWEGLERKRIISPITIGHAAAVCLLFTWGKNSYVRSYGDEVLGSYFEKPEYRTRYYVNVFPEENGSKNYRLPADIHVFSKVEDGETTEDFFGQEQTETSTTKYIILDKAFWPNGGYLDFDNCQLQFGEKVLCDDQEGEDWYIEITNEKVR